MATIISKVHDRTLELSDGRLLQPEQRIEDFEVGDLERGYAAGGVLHIDESETEQPANDVEQPVDSEQPAQGGDSTSAAEQPRRSTRKTTQKED